MRYKLDPTAPSGISKVTDDIVPYFAGGAGKPSLLDSVNGKHGAVNIVGGTNVTVDNSGDDITISASGGGGTGAVDSVNGQTGTVILDADDINDASTTNKFVTATDITNLGNLSGTNTGDQDLSGYATTASLATVATSGAYTDLSGTPTIPSSIDDLSDVDTTTTAPTDTQVLAWNGTDSKWEPADAATGSGSGDVVGPASSTDNAIARFDSTTGKLLQDSSVTISDTGSLSADELVVTDVVASAGVFSNTIGERTTDFGVTVDGVLIKDGLVDGKDVSTLTDNTGDVTLNGIQALTNKDLTDATNTFPTFNQDTTGNAATATKLLTARTFRTNLASTTTASFNGTANVTPGVTGTLPVANGGTGTTTSTGSGSVVLGTSPTLTTPKIGQINDTNGNTAAVLDATASAVNYLHFANGATGSAPALTADGSDTDINLFLRGRGSGSVIVADGNANTVYQGTGVASAINSVNITNAATGSAPSVAAQGGDTNVGLNLKSKGTGTVQANGTPVVTTTDTQTLTNKDLSSSTNTFPTGMAVQTVSTNYSAVATGTTQIPEDDTIPQITEGFEVMTQTITPKSSTNLLVITVTVMASHDTANRDHIVALFQDSTANALYATIGNFVTVATAMATTKFTFTTTAGTTSATTFRVRIGSNSTGTMTFNGQSGGRKFGATPKSNITITEYKA